MKKIFDRPTWVPTTEGMKQVTELVLPNTPKVFGKPKNFDRAMQRLKATGKLSLEDFNNTAEIGAFIDFYNQMNTEQKRKRGDEDIHEISKYLVKTMTQSSILINKPRVIKQDDLLKPAPKIEEKPVQDIVDDKKKG